MLFTLPKRQLDCDLKMKLNGKRLYERDSVKYLGTQIEIVMKPMKDEH